MTSFIIGSSGPTPSLYIDFSDNNAAVELDGGMHGDVLRGGSGDDILDGGDGNDILEGGRGTNTFDGGAGTNTLSYENFDAPGIGIPLGMIIRLSTGNAADWSSGNIVVDTFSNISNVRGTRFDDSIEGNTQNNVIEGGAGNDQMLGGDGIDTLSYEHSSAGVNADLDRGFGIGGDAEGDQQSEFENILGSTFDDYLSGTDDANTLNGNGGNDILFGRGGDDRLVISSTPGIINGGDGKDFLFVQGGGSVSLAEAEAAFTGIETVYVRNDTHLDMSAVQTGAKITSQSTAGHAVEIIGSAGTDTIKAGKGGDLIEGGASGDKLFAGSGADTFHFQAGFGRDNVYGFNTATDHITVDIAGVDALDIKLTSFHGGRDTIVTFTGVEGTNKIILHDVTMDQIKEGPSDLFMFGA